MTVKAKTDGPLCSQESAFRKLEAAEFVAEIGDALTTRLDRMGLHSLAQLVSVTQAEADAEVMSAHNRAWQAPMIRCETRRNHDTTRAGFIHH